VLEGAFEDDGDDLPCRYAACMANPWSGATRSSVDDAQGAESHVIGIVVAVKREGVVGVEPAVVESGPGHRICGCDHSCPLSGKTAPLQYHGMGSGVPGNCGCAENGNYGRNEKDGLCGDGVGVRDCLGEAVGHLDAVVEADAVEGVADDRKAGMAGGELFDFGAAFAVAERVLRDALLPAADAREDRVGFDAEERVEFAADGLPKLLVGEIENRRVACAAEHGAELHMAGRSALQQRLTKSKSSRDSADFGCVESGNRSR